MKTIHVDVAVIGAGTAGLTAYRTAKAAGANAAIIEGGDYGTTCARVGCMPSKLLIAAAEAANAVKRAPGFGIHVDGSIRINGREVMDRVRRERDRFVASVLRDVQDIPDADRIRGHARFVNNQTLAVADHIRVTAKSVVIASGSRAAYPDSFRDLGDRLIINDDVFNWHDLPKAVAVIGPGIVGLELGQALHRLGVHVAVLGRGGRVGPINDPEIRAYALTAFNEEYTLEPDAHIAAMQRYGDRVAIRRTGPNGVGETEYFDYVLAADHRTDHAAGDLAEIAAVSLDFDHIDGFDHAAIGAASGGPARGRHASGRRQQRLAEDGAHLPISQDQSGRDRRIGQDAVAVLDGVGAFIDACRHFLQE